MVRNVLIDPATHEEMDPEALELFNEQFRKAVRWSKVWMVVLQVLGTITLITGLMLVSVAVGLCVLGCLMILFGIAIERGLYAR